MMNTAVIGYGYWGRNIARAVNESADFVLGCVCDISPEARARARKLYPSTAISVQPSDIPAAIDTVAIVTPVCTHFELAKTFMLQGKNVLLTKPATKSLAEFDELLAIASRTGKTVFVDNTFVFNPAVRAVKAMLPKIGKPYFAISQRLNLGLFQSDVDVAYDLLPHDVSIISFIFDAKVAQAKLETHCAASLPQADLAQATFSMDNGVRCMSTVSWLAPAKVRELTIVGSEGMLTYNDVAESEKVKFYDRGISYREGGMADPQAAYTTRISYRAGDMFSPAVPKYEALAEELKEFALASKDESVRTYYNTLNRNVVAGLETIIQSRSG